ncbi:multicomponent Na+:H+ antiporter subunit D [Rhizobium sp. RU20A]|nr:multicomponent Na+:H+ antiporter subunit D [Rhizobium sp. RU20A]
MTLLPLAAAPAGVDLAAAYRMAAPGLAEWLTILPVAWCLLAGAVLTAMRGATRLHPGLTVAALAVLVVMDAALLVHVATHGPVTMMMGRWLPPFGIAFTVDMLGALFALTAAVVALLVSIQALGEVDDGRRRYGFYPFLLLLMAGVSGAFLTGDLFNLYVWFEVLLIASFGLLVLGSEKTQIDGTVKYGFLNLVATTLFLIGVGLTYGALGTLNMADIAAKLAAEPLGVPAVTLAGLFLFAFAMKAAAFPVNFWLPAAYHTPNVAVSALFAGLLTKVGIYALIRVCVMLMPAATGELSLPLGLVALATMLVGSFGALAQDNLRRLFGYLVVAGIGAILAGVAIGGATGLAGAIVYAVHSMVVMAALYGVAALALAVAGSERLTTLAGLWTARPVLAALSLMLFLSAAGLPPFSGLWPKVMLIRAALEGGWWWLAAGLILMGLLTTLALGRVFLLAFWRPVADGAVAGGSATSVTPGRAVPLSLGVLGLMSALTLGFGLYPEPLIAAANEAAAGLLDPTAYRQSVFPPAMNGEGTP